ncbi:MAG TPA: tRNA pseudouridine(38-40) synthase TruA [Aequorivita sp.]|nr:tRNA pseudouridine(38-40) synthase TruA [Aequorivita sp.]
MRYFIEIAYSGKNYYGWQRQPKQISVQQVLEESLSTVLRREIVLVGSGRTDTGVHAKQLFAHFDSDKIENKEKLVFRLNSFLPKDISVKNIFEVKADAHARFDALQREYEYRIAIGKDPFSQGFTYQIYNKPNVEAMNEAAGLLLGHTDFQCFSRSKTDVRTYNCNVIKAKWEENNNELVFTIIADRFLRNMVRAIVGTLLDVGFGKITLKRFEEILNSKNREQAGASAPPQGLYLTEVVYPESLFLKKEMKTCIANPNTELNEFTN